MKQGIYSEIVGAKTQPVRVICLPPDPSHASDDDWANARRLSLALAEREGCDGLAEIALGLPDEPVSDNGWRAIVIPRSLDATKDEIESDTATAKRIEIYLRAVTDVDDAVRHLRGAGTNRVIAAAVAGLTVWTGLRQ